MADTAEPVQDQQETATRIVIHPALRDPEVMYLTKFLALFTVLAGVGAVVSVVLARSGDAVLCAVAAACLCALELIYRAIAVHTYVSIDRDKVRVGLFKRWPYKTVDRSEIGSIRWAAGSAKVHGRILDAQGHVLADLSQFISRQKAVRIAELLGVPFDGRRFNAKKIARSTEKIG